MKILVDCHIFDGKFQGTRTYVEGIYTNLVSHMDIEFYFAAKDTEKLKTIFGVSDNVHYLKLNSSNGLSRLLFEIPELIKKYSIDYVHFQYISTWKKYCKEIVTCHDVLFLDMPQYFPWHFRLMKGFFFKRSAKRADLLLTVSEYSKSAISHHFSIPKDYIHITPNAVLPYVNISNLPDVKKKYSLDKYILTVSRIEPRKNHILLLKAFVELQLVSKGYKLIMVGSSDFKCESFSEYLDSLEPEIQKEIIIKPVPFVELVELYRNASLFVFPSFAEGFGIPPLEAIEYGCPLLCSNATAMAEFHLPEDILFDPSNLEELKEKILKELDRPMDLSNVSTFIRDKFNWKKIASDFYNVLIENNKQ